MMNTLKLFFATMTASVLTLASSSAVAAQPTIEILAMPHPPVQMALQPLRDWIANQGGKLKVVEVNIESTQGEKRLAAAGLDGHIPILILIDGKYRYRRKDGSQVAFVNFPAIQDAPPGVRGEWSVADVQNVLTNRMKKP
jgi:hypothetical protein